MSRFSLQISKTTHRERMNSARSIILYSRATCLGSLSMRPAASGSSTPHPLLSTAKPSRTQLALQPLPVCKFLLDIPFAIRLTCVFTDTGTSLLLVDDAVAQAYYAQVQGAVNDAQAGGFTYPCTATLPDFGVAIGDSYVANVPGDQITFSTVDTAGTTCFGGVQSNGGATLQIYGDTMFKAQFVAFNGGNQSLGLAPKA